jgi:hypothetical protein
VFKNTLISNKRSQRAARPAGVSLLELILALSLTTVVMGLIAMAIDLNFRMFDTRRSQVEETQLARSLLRHIGDDIRASVEQLRPDLTGLETVAGNSQNASSVLGGSAAGALGGALGGAGGGQGGNQDSGGSGQNATGGGGASGSGGGSSGGGQSGGGMGGLGGATASTLSVNPQTQQATSTYGDQSGSTVVGLYGTSTELQLDVSRLPRLDQYQAEMSQTGVMGVVDIPSDMKTITYFLRSEEAAAAGAIPGMAVQSSVDGRGRGLMRRVLDRAVSAWAEENGTTSGTLGETELLANEVVGLEFAYFDGASWASEWDSVAMQGLPVAIEIRLMLQLTDGSQQTATLNPLASLSEEIPDEKMYTLTVNLPTATPYEEKAQQQSTEDTALSQTGALDTSGDAAAANAGGGGFGGGMGAGGQNGGRGGNGQGGGGRGDQGGGGGGRGGQGGGFGGQGGFGGGMGGGFGGGGMGGGFGGGGMGGGGMGGGTGGGGRGR